MAAVKRMQALQRVRSALEKTLGMIPPRSLGVGILRSCDAAGRLDGYFLEAVCYRLTPNQPPHASLVPLVLAATFIHMFKAIP